MLEIQIHNDEKTNLFLAKFIRDGESKCTIDYNALRMQLLNPDQNLKDFLVGQFLWVLEDGFTKKLTKQELRVLGDFLDALETGKTEFQNQYSEKKENNI